MSAALSPCQHPLRWLALSVWLLSTACSTLQVSVQHDESTDFSAYRTYAWSVGDRTDTGNPIVDDNAMMDRQIRALVDAELQARGMTPAGDADPDLTVHYHALLERKAASMTTREYESYAGAEVLRAEHTEITEYTEGTLILDIHDARREELVWRGVAREAVDDLITNPDRAEKELGGAVRKILAGFPPGK